MNFYKSSIAAVSICSLLLTGAHATYAAPLTETDSEHQQGKKAKNLSPKEWLELKSFLLNSAEPGTDLEDIEPLRDMIGSASIVGLGEANHGSREIFTMKHRIVEFLVMEMGFTTLVLEENWGNALELDHYVLTGEGNPSEYLMPLFQTQEIVDMLEWMREYNADPENEEKLRVVGMDVQNVSENVYDEIRQYIKEYKPDLLPRVDKKMKELAEVTKDLETYTSLPEAIQKKHHEQAKEITKILEQNKKRLNGQSEEFSKIKQHAKVIEQFTGMYFNFSENPSEVFLRHDIAMFENAKWAHEQLGKTIVWGHNGHIAKSNIVPDVYPKLAGQHLLDHYGKKYVTIGTSFGKGDFNAYNSENKIVPVTIESNDKTSNHTLDQVSKDQYFVDLRTATGLTKKWLDEERPFLNGFGSANPNKPNLVTAALGQTFDILIHIDTVSAGKLVR
ncbi:erythromycin esterase family protein [Brevibacillus brevis]|uniref:Erythromycin esterase family protein n=1 Tax=Brevibacillus brevis TaxID=1393 RepID=A0A517IDL0_BREBE|nr:erythromycin esterase family protein [Brevibacillus brevis]QDS36986.1 erythromycin esterase family protein [Brevibacillus brevis]